MGRVELGLNKDLREINLVDFRRSKIAILTILEALNYDFLKKYSFEKLKSVQNIKYSEQLKCSK